MITASCETYSLRVAILKSLNIFFANSLVSGRDILLLFGAIRVDKRLLFFG